MVRQSLYITSLQILNLLVSVFIMIYIASRVDPKDYSVFILYQVTTTFIAALSFIGYESHLIRNALSWCNNGSKLLISESVVRAVKGRLVLWLLMILPVMLYLESVIPASYRETDEYITEGFLIAGLFVSLLQCSALVLKSLNKYFFAIFISVTGMMVCKIISLLVYFYAGYKEFLWSNIILTCMLGIVALLVISDYLRAGLNFRFSLLDLRRHYQLALASHAQYITIYFDRIIVSLFVPAEVLSSYGIARQLQEAGKTVIEGFFDPITQRAVAYRGDAERISLIFSKSMKMVRMLLLFGGGVLGSILSLVVFNHDESLLGLELDSFTDYPHLIHFILFAAMSLFVMLASKIYVNYNAYFMPVKILLVAAIIISLGSIIIVATSSLILPHSYIYTGRFFVEILVYFTAIILFKRYLNGKVVNTIL